MPYIFNSIINAIRFKCINIGAGKRFSSFESEIKGLKSEQLNELRGYFVEEFKKEDTLAKNTSSLHDISGALKRYDEDDISKKILEEKTTRRKARWLKRVLDECISFTGSYKKNLIATSRIIRGRGLENINFSGAEISRAIKSLQVTGLSFLHETYDNDVRNAIKHGDDWIQHGSWVFDPDGERHEISFEELSQFTYKYIGDCYVLMSIPVLTSTEGITREADREFFESQLKQYQNIDWIK